MLVKSRICIVYLFIRGPCQYESFVLCTSNLYPVRATPLVMCTQHIHQHPYPERQGVENYRAPDLVCCLGT